MTTKTNILDFWPIESPPRDNQIKALEWIQENISKRFFILEAPVGSGKSLIGVTFARYVDSFHRNKQGETNQKSMGNSWVITPQKILQDQYMDDFADNELVKAKKLMGKGNYECKKAPVSCEVASTVLKCDCTCFKPEFERAMEYGNTIMNYHNMMAYSTFTDELPVKDLLVIDECHNIENILVDYDTIEISSRQLMGEMGLRLPPNMNDLDSVYMWLQSTVLSALFGKEEDVKEELRTLNVSNSSTGAEALIRKRNYYSNLINNIKQLPKSVEEFKDTFVTYLTDKNDFVVKPLFPANAFRKLEGTAGRILMMSGTIPDKEEFCQTLGIDMSLATFLSVDSEFPAENRQVLYAPVMRMNYGWRDNFTGQEDMLDFIGMILDKHSGESGVIHTTNFQIAIWLTEQIEKLGTHKVFHHNPQSNINREDAINSFLENDEPSVIISPSITEGLDLHGDLGRFNIIAKLPYPFLGDAWDKTRMQLSDKWYQQKTLISILQAIGRTTRSKDDYSETYILDSSWDMLFTRIRHLLPQWWLDGYSRI